MSAKAGSATNITYQEYFLLLGLSQSDFLTRVLRSDKTIRLRALISASRDYMVVRTRTGTMCVPWLSIMSESHTAVRRFQSAFGLVMRFLFNSFDLSRKAATFSLLPKRACHLREARRASDLRGMSIERSMNF